MTAIFKIQPPPKKDSEFFDDWIIRLRSNMIYGAAPTLTITANVITPTTPVSFLGAGLVKTITAVANGTITIIPTGAFTTDATGNIAIASTGVVSRAMTLTYDTGTSRWYPSY